MDISSTGKEEDVAKSRVDLVGSLLGNTLHGDAALHKMHPLRVVLPF